MKRLINSAFSAILALLVIAGCSDMTNSGVDTDDGLSLVENATSKSNYKDEDGNGIPDVGEVVTGFNNEAFYLFDASGDWYWDLGDGRILGSVNSPSELDQATLSRCDYILQYRGKFENDPYQDTGWIKNVIKCNGYAYDTAKRYVYNIVHETEPRYTGNGTPIWNTWEYHVDVESGLGNKLINPQNHSN